MARVGIWDLGYGGLGGAVYVVVGQSWPVLSLASTVT